MTRKHTISRTFLDAMANLDVDKAFLVPGAQVDHIVRELNHHPDIEPVMALHELGAAYMAIGYARASGKPALAISIGGPGSSYMMGAAISAKADRVPVLFITGDVPSRHRGFGEFQDAGPAGTNDSQMFLAAIGESHICHFVEDVPRILSAVHATLADGRPCHVQLPIDMQNATLEPQPLNPEKQLSVRQKDFQLPLEEKSRVVLMIGRSALGLVEPQALHAFVKAQQIGVVTDLSARGIIPESSKQSLGFVGFNSDPRALDALNSSSGNFADMVLTVGVRRETIKQYVSPDIPILKIVPEDLPSLARMSSPTAQNPQVLQTRKDWIASLACKKPLFEESTSPRTGVSYLRLLRTLTARLPTATRYCLDAGQIRRAGSILISCEQPRTLIQSDSLSPMGYGLCASIGAKLACPNDPVVALIGDGSMRMHGMEVATAIRHQASVIFVLVDNCAYASLLNREGMESHAELMAVDWAMFARSNNLPCIAVDNCSRIDDAVQEAIDTQGPVLLWVKVGRLLDAELKQAHQLEYKNWLSTLQNIKK
uniref:Acetolactate synthase large subunit n=1 Tax=Candidatus Kentrum sp. DK TaxID=2126562 RepID=A0A450TE10_9GAMM|nr:MAG: Acetolactate synthase large subunit [Candidatus Kentron sp. DK]